jgi:hypothetical protein
MVPDMQPACYATSSQLIAHSIRQYKNAMHETALCAGVSETIQPDSTEHADSWR